MGFRVVLPGRWQTSRIPISRWQCDVALPFSADPPLQVHPVLFIPILAPLAGMIRVPRGLCPKGLVTLTPKRLICQRRLLRHSKPLDTTNPKMRLDWI